MKSEEQKDEEVQVVSDKQAFDDDEGIAGCPWEDDKPIVQYVTTPSLSMEMEPRTNSVACSWVGNLGDLISLI